MCIRDSRQGERFPGHVAEGVVFVERGRHGGGPLLRSRIPPCADEAPPVSYTHLDVYKRQGFLIIIPG